MVTCPWRLVGAALLAVAASARAGDGNGGGAVGVSATRRAALSTYGWGGVSWDGSDDPHGYGGCDQLEEDLRIHGANSYNFLFYDSAGQDYLLAVQCLEQFQREKLAGAEHDA